MKRSELKKNMYLDSLLVLTLVKKSAVKPLTLYLTETGLPFQLIVLLPEK